MRAILPLALLVAGCASKPQPSLTPPEGSVWVTVNVSPSVAATPSPAPAPKPHAIPSPSAAPSSPACRDGVCLPPPSPVASGANLRVLGAVVAPPAAIAAGPDKGEAAPPHDARGWWVALAALSTLGGVWALVRMGAGRWSILPLAGLIVIALLACGCSAQTDLSGLGAGLKWQDGPQVDINAGRHEGELLGAKASSDLSLGLGAGWDDGPKISASAGKHGVSIPSPWADEPAQPASHEPATKHGLGGVWLVGMLLVAGLYWLARKIRS